MEAHTLENYTAPEVYEQEAGYSCGQVRKILKLRENFTGIRAMAISFLSGNSNARVSKEFVSFVKDYGRLLTEYPKVLGEELEEIERLTGRLNNALTNFENKENA